MCTDSNQQGSALWYKQAMGIKNGFSHLTNLAFLHNTREHIVEGTYSRLPACLQGQTSEPPDIHNLNIKSPGSVQTYVYDFSMPQVSVFHTKQTL